jgi:hypothetical protein
MFPPGNPGYLFLLFWAWSHSAARPIGVRQEVISQPTREVVGLGRTPTPSSRRSIHGISMRDVMLLHSSRVPIRLCPTLRFTLTPSVPFILSTRASALRLLSRSDVTRRTYTSMEMYAFPTGGSTTSQLTRLCSPGTCQPSPSQSSYTMRFSHGVLLAQLM